MSSKLTLAAAAAVRCALAAAYAWASPHLLAPNVYSRHNATPPQAPTAAEMRSPADSTVAGPANDLSPAPTSTAAGDRVPISESDLLEKMTPSARLLRSSLAHGLGCGKRPKNDAHQTNVSNTVHTSAGSYDFERATGSTTEYYHLAPAPAYPSTPFVLDPTKVSVITITSSDSSPLAVHDSGTYISMCGQLPKDQAALLTQDGPIQYLTQLITWTDVFPMDRPAQYEINTVIQRLGWTVTETASLKAVLDTAQTKDAAFLSAVRLWRQAGSTSTQTTAAEAAWQAASELKEAQKACADAFDEYLKMQVSGEPSWAVYQAGRQVERGISVSALFEAFTTGTQSQARSSGNDPSKPGTVPPNASVAVEFTLRCSDESLQNLAAVISKNPLTGALVEVDPELANLCVEGTFQGKTTREVLVALAQKTGAALKGDDAHGWKLFPSPTPAAPSGEGF